MEARALFLVLLVLGQEARLRGKPWLNVAGYFKEEILVCLTIFLFKAYNLSILSSNC